MAEYIIVKEIEGIKKEIEELTFDNYYAALGFSAYLTGNSREKATYRVKPIFNEKTN